MGNVMTIDLGAPRMAHGVQETSIEVDILYGGRVIDCINSTADSLSMAACMAINTITEKYGAYNKTRMEPLLRLIWR